MQNLYQQTYFVSKEGMVVIVGVSSTIIHSKKFPEFFIHSKKSENVQTYKSEVFQTLRKKSEFFRHTKRW